MFPYLIPIAVLSQITGTKVVRLRKMYEPILTVYVDDLEKLLKLKFTSDVRNELFALCTDMENGGLGIFIYLLENTLTFVRPEWEAICLEFKRHEESDLSELATVIIDRDILRQSSRFQMKK